jgi:hypothetical protein
MPQSPVVAVPPAAQAPRLAARRRPRYGSRLALPIGLWGAAGRPPTALAAARFGARSRV